METSSKTAPRSDEIARTVFGSEPAEQKPHVPSQMLATARSEYAAGRVEEALRLLEPLVQELTQTEGATQQQTDGPPTDGSASWAFLARVAARAGRAELSAKAGKRAADLLMRVETQNAAQSPEELVDAAIALYIAQRPEPAAELVRKGVMDADAETRLYEGLIWWELGHAEDAARALRLARDVKEEALQRRRLEALGAALEKLGANHSEEAAGAYFDLANVHYRAARYPETLAAIERTLELSPQHVGGLAAKGEVLRLLGQAEKALPFVEQALKLRPDFAWAHAVHGETLRALDRTAESADAFRKAVELDGSVAGWHARLGEALILLDKPTEAMPTLNAALQLNPDERTARIRRGEAHRRLRHFEEAVEDFQNCLTRESNDTWALANKGETLRQMSRLSDAEAALQRAVDLSPSGYPFAETSLGHVWLDGGRSKEALGMFERVLKSNPNYGWAMEGQAHALFNLDQITKAIAVAVKVIELQPDSAWTHGLHGVLLIQVEEYAGGVVALERCTTLDGSLDWAFDALGTGYLWRWRSESRADASLVEKAIDAGRKASQLRSDDPSWLATMAEAMWLAGTQHRAEAENNYRQVLAAAQKKEKLDYHEAINAGWAALRLASIQSEAQPSLLDEAERLTVEALSQKIDAPGSLLAIEARFNLALVMLCTGRVALALREYETGVALAAKHQEPPVYRGLLGRVSAFLTEAVADWPSLQTSHHAEKTLKKLHMWRDAGPGTASA